MRSLRQMCAHTAWLTGGLFLLATTPVLAESTNAELKAEIETLKVKMSQMESKLQQSGGAAAYQEPESGGSVLRVPNSTGVQISGFVDTTYTYNFNEPQTRTNTLRVFDTRANSFMLNNVELVVEKPVSDTSRTGFRADLDFGSDSEVIGALSTGLGTGDDELDIQQAYAEYLAPVGNGLNLKAGKFVTLHGGEVIEAKDNWNISRSLLFGFAEPATHTGLRASYAWGSWLTTCLGVNNGWDIVDDNNQGKSIEASVVLVPLERSSLAINYMGGPEQTGNNGNQRNLLDLVAWYQPTDALQFKFNLDYGWEDDATAFTKNASWTGIAGYIRHQCTDRLALTGRAEWLHDADGVRTAILTGVNGITGTDLSLIEYTLTGEYKINDHIFARLEYRHDQSTENVFRHDDVGQKSYQDTLAMQFIAPF